MKITFLFHSLKDWSAMAKGEELLEILFANGFIIEKASEYEPIRGVFNKQKFSDIWKIRGIEGQFADCCFLFKGQMNVKFSGMASWSKNLPSGSKAVNGLHLFLNIPKNFDYCKLIQIGDELFKWSEAEYGYITEDSKEQINLIAGNIYDSITALRWVNYFGPAYLVEPNFHLPDDKVMVHHGARIALAETPNDERLRDTEYLNSIKKMIGAEWFWDYPQRHKRKRPLFDASAITKLIK